MKQLRYLIIISIFSFSTLAVSAQKANTAKSTKATTENPNDTLASNNPSISIDIHGVNELLKATEDLLVSYNTHARTNNWAKIDSAFTKKEAFITQEAEDFRALNQASLSKFFLENLRLAWGSYHNSIQDWQSGLESQLATSVENSNKLFEKKVDLEKYAIKAIENDLNALAERISKTTSDIDTVINLFNKNQQILLLLQTRVAEKNILAERIIEEIEVLEATLRGQTFTRTQHAIWDIQLNNTIKDGLVSSFNRAYRNNYKSLKYYYSNLSSGLVEYILLSGLIIFFILFIRKRYIGLGLNAETPGYVSIERVLLKHPWIITFTILTTLWANMFPFIPMLLSDSLLFTILLVLGIILKQFIDKTGKKLLTTLILLLFFNILEVVIWYLGDYSRIYLLFETIIGLILIFPFFTLYKKKADNDNNKTRIVHLAKRFMPLVLGMYFIAFLGNMFGYINVTVLFIKIGIRTAAVTTIAYGYARILENISIASLSLLNTRFPNIMTNYGDVITKRIKKAITFLVIFLWAESILRIFEIKAIFHSWIGKFFTTEASIGSISLSLSDVLLFVGILYTTYLIVTFIKRIIEEEILRKVKLPRGIPAAISMILRISIVTLGILFAISATGINMSSFGMIAGALGVGIGFGLQNIVQNFISGLILIFERPIQVGDTVEVDNLMGRVKDIGVRASNVITYDGAEVVVPNSNLISNNLINWTLSDSRKRVEIKVGTAYGSDPNQVLDILFKVANEHPDVVKNPEPRALFDGFGESSLDFRLLFWVSFELGLGAKSDVAIGIYNAFAENGIEIPFPQVDLHVRDIVKQEPIDKPVIPQKENKEKSSKEPLNEPESETDSEDDLN